MTLIFLLRTWTFLFETPISLSRTRYLCSRYQPFCQEPGISVRDTDISVKIPMSLFKNLVSLFKDTDISVKNPVSLFKDTDICQKPGIFVQEPDISVQDPDISVQDPDI